MLISLEHKSIYNSMLVLLRYHPVLYTIITICVVNIHSRYFLDCVVCYFIQQYLPKVNDHIFTKTEKGKEKKYTHP